ncbi:MAG TPA: methylamine dehydrogenase (amicyanin) small subunit [Steroidobacteraceae bacterium]|nr:methylamine dehydrogenase (amicyanin) small subunit [Steroidobacteraceae bacterium]
MSDSNGDRMVERVARIIARRTSRRSLLTRLGVFLVAAPVFPLLPVSRALAATAPPKAPLTDFERNAQSKDPTKCDYWRHCAIDGVICGCCGGGIHTCPPGSEPSPTAWIGTCLNPDDGRSYLIAYRDCCGKNICTADKSCMCDGTDREMPVYRPQGDNDIIWCFGQSSMSYHCSTAALIGQAT